MQQPSDNNRAPCADMLKALPIPVAVVDREGQVVYANTGYLMDALPVHSLRLNAEHFQQVIQTRASVFFEETLDGGNRLLWLYAPLLDAEGQVDDVLLLGLDVTGVCRQAAAEARHTLVERVAREVQVPLMALVGLTNSLAHELTGTQGERAAVIRQHGKLLLKQLRALLASAPPGPIDTPMLPSTG